MKIAILGASKGMGRALARRLAPQHDLCLLGRDVDDLARSARDLEVRGNKREGSVGVVHCDLAAPAGFGAAMDAAQATLGGLDAFVVSAATFATQEALEADTPAAIELLTIDLANTIGLCEHARKRLLAQGGGRLVVFSSVAGDRGRKPVAIYGAAKAGLSHYLESLDHRWRADGLITICVKPGFVRTSMTEGLKAPPFAGDPEGVARIVERALLRGTPVVYAPPIWGWIMAVIRRLPRAVMRRVGF